MELVDCKSAANLAALLRHLARVSEPEGNTGGLPPGQWHALRYFAQANRFSRTVSGFAAFNATTRGTASQTVKALEEAGYLVRTPSPEDRRRLRIDLTEAGRAKLAEDPARVLVRAIEDLPEEAQQSLDCQLARLLTGVSAERGQARFGTCPSCAHLGVCVARVDSQGGYFCYWAGEYLESDEMGGLCVTFTPRDSEEG